MMAICLQCKRPIPEDNLLVDGSRNGWIKFFCSIQCKDSYLYPKLTSRICARDRCYRRVPEGNRMLCLECYYGADTLGESYPIFDETDNRHLEYRQQVLRKGLEEKVRVYSTKDMTQEELKLLVPSLQGRTRGVINISL